MTRLVIVGGSDAGTEAALRARVTDPSLEITVLVADDFLNYSICGLPFLVSGEVGDWRDLAHRDASDIADRGIEVLLGHRALSIDASGHSLDVEADRKARAMPFDRLVIATGARPAVPPIRGLDLEGVHVLHTMSDGIALWERVRQRSPRDAVIVGSGYIGVELADALTRRGIGVTLVGRATTVLPTIDPSLGADLVAEFERNGVVVIDRATVGGIAEVAGRLSVSLGTDEGIEADLVVVAAGVRPEVDLAATIGVRTGVGGAVRVDQRMETSAADVWAAGDCVETWHAVLGKPTYLPLGTTAHKQGRVAGENAAGGDASYRGSVGTQVVKVFELAAARTGLTAVEAAAAEFSPVSVETTAPDHKRYYPGARDLRMLVIGDAPSRRLLGVQIVGPWQTDVAKRIDVAAAALHEAMTVDDLLDLDLSYTPPLGSPWDPIQIAANAWATEVSHVGAAAAVDRSPVV